MPDVALKEVLAVVSNVAGVPVLQVQSYLSPYVGLHLGPYISPYRRPV